MVPCLLLLAPVFLVVPLLVPRKASRLVPTPASSYKPPCSSTRKAKTRSSPCRLPICSCSLWVPMVAGQALTPVLVATLVQMLVVLVLRLLVARHR